MSRRPASAAPGRPTRDEVIARADARFSAIVREQDALSIEDAARAALWRGGPSFESIVEHLAAVRDARARRARGEHVPPIPPLSIERAARMDAARVARTPAVAA
ncbi:hypothetical protein CHO01_25620 [Cellulomonas hominis]|uniref:Uncharacterized protein n=1 Tax=Cellulomonas hominis TaxID=156981 RepID=A0A511FDX4_9CELL|nr:hypothetical protein [Cellulomonas hominis]MBB5472529.1 hypothetical protein [Cellulomonas hominis]NKY05557.1 hypothetical protein [Cellulomonas hominis]GEL47446.1 hypothetical protein CHO01_25620 [Cellulomonas hominis]